MQSRICRSSVVRVAVNLIAVVLAASLALRAALWLGLPVCAAVCDFLAYVIVVVAWRLFLEYSSLMV
jgi:hypothetical protein